MRTMKKHQPNYFPAFFDSFIMKDLFDAVEARPVKKETSFPAVNILEKEQEYEVALAVPGYKKEEFSVLLENNELSISVEKENPAEEEKGQEKFISREFGYPSFKRVFRLPENKIDEAKVEAKYEDGVLRLTLPKKVEEEFKPKQIQVV